MPKKLILRTWLSLGDVVCFSAAVRELHRQYPGEFLTDVETPFPEIWDYNPHITPIAAGDPGAKHIECHYDRDAYFTVNKSNEHPIHMIEGYCQDLANNLGVPSLRPQELKGHIYLNEDEYGWQSMPHERHNVQRYWVICPGGKTDFTTKWWVPEYYQRVVDYFRGRIQFVQVGQLDNGNVHPLLNNVIDLRGQTDVRQLIRVIHSACGVLCGITSLMHLAAAVPLPRWARRPRPCVVVAGGRESRTWYGYPTHRILETVGSLPCCQSGGCWHARTVPLHTAQDNEDGSDGSDGCDPANSRLCERVVNGHPKCMQMIRPESVILEIERILESEGLE